MKPTDVGKAFYERCKAIVGAAEEAELSVTELSAVPRGRLRIAAPVALGQRYLNDVVGDYLTLYPEVRIELDLTDRAIDLHEEGVDLVLRVGARKDPSLIARQLLPARQIVVGAPRYFSTHPLPETPADVGAHACLLCGHDTPPDTWRFAGPDGEIAVRVEGRVTSNSLDALAAAACDGLGLAMLPDFVVADELRTGRLLPALDDWCPSLGGIHAVYPHDRHLSAKVRAFVDELVATFSSR